MFFHNDFSSPGWLFAIAEPGAITNKQFGLICSESLETAAMVAAWVGKSLYICRALLPFLWWNLFAMMGRRLLILRVRSPYSLSLLVGRAESGWSNLPHIANDAETKDYSSLGSQQTAQANIYEWKSNCHVNVISAVIWKWATNDE